MLRRFPMINGLRARIALALFAAVLFQFAGNEIIFAKVEETRMERGRSQRLADWLLFADEFVDISPDALHHMNDMWESRLHVERQDQRPVLGNALADHDITQEILDLQPGLAALDLRAIRDGDALEGRIRLSKGGGWLRFRSDDYYQGYSLSYHYTAALLLLIASVVLLALLFGRMIGRPLARIAEAAEQVGRDDPVPIAIEGPREVRQVAAAFERMQARLLGHVSERVQSLAAMSHDLRTPLARLRLNASTVDDPETRAALEQDIDEMEAFVSSVLDYLRGDDPEQAQSADIASIAMTVVDEARDGGGEVDYSGPCRLEGHIRPLKLKRLLRNIVQNGVRHAGGAHLHLSGDDRQIILRIEDEGPGIPKGKLDEVFEPFTRVEQSRYRRRRLGIGHRAPAFAANGRNDRLAEPPRRRAVGDHPDSASLRSGLKKLRTNRACYRAIGAAPAGFPTARVALIHWLRGMSSFGHETADSGGVEGVQMTTAGEL